MKLVQTVYGYDIYELSRSESFMRGRNNRQFVAFVSGENFDTIGAPEIETESFAEVLNYCSEYRINDTTQKQEALNDKVENSSYLKDCSYCPAENAGYSIIKQEEVTDIDGTKLGTVLGKNASGNFVTWDYSYFPKTNHFNGFNNGHYFSGEKCELKANADFHRRIAERAERIAAYEEIQEDCAQEDFDMEE